MCSQWLSRGKMCCKECNHPGRWAKDPWTADDMREMWDGHEIPTYITKEIRRLERDGS